MYIYIYTHTYSFKKQSEIILPFKNQDDAGAHPIIATVMKAKIKNK